MNYLLSVHVVPRDIKSLNYCEIHPVEDSLDPSVLSYANAVAAMLARSSVDGGLAGQRHRMRLCRAAAARKRPANMAAARITELNMKDAPLREKVAA